MTVFNFNCSITDTNLDWDIPFFICPPPPLSKNGQFLLRGVCIFSWKELQKFEGLRFFSKVPPKLNPLDYFLQRDCQQKIEGSDSCHILGWDGANGGGGNLQIKNGMSHLCKTTQMSLSSSLLNMKCTKWF